MKGFTTGAGYLAFMIGILVFCSHSSSLHYGGGVIVITSGLVNDDIHMKFAECPASISPAILRDIIDSNGKVVFSQTSKKTKEDYADLDLPAGQYTLVVQIGETSQSVTFYAQ